MQLHCAANQGRLLSRTTFCETDRTGPATPQPHFLCEAEWGGSRSGAAASPDLARVSPDVRSALVRSRFNDHLLSKRKVAEQCALNALSMPYLLLRMWQ